MPPPALLLLIATLLPLLSFTILVFVGKRMGPLAGIVGTLAIAGSFGCSIGAMMVWLQDSGAAWGAGKLPIDLTFPWLPVGAGINQKHEGFLDVGIYVDSLTITMFAMITLVATLVHVFSIGYMREDKRFPRFFTYLGLFCFSMLGLVIGGTAIQLFVFWELVGLCSYLLIGFWYEKKSASNAAIKAFVTNRVGDFGFLIGFGILFYHLGNVSLPDMWVALNGAGTGAAVTLSNGVVFSSGLLTMMGIGLFFGAVGKSAQFPLHVWLPDAMEGPTPVSALIHAATMVAAGVYLVGRIFPILTPDAKLFIAIIGCVTLTMAALIALAQSDIKKVLAFSTLSQLGYMILAMGIGSWVGGLFHLITHAFFKALLFLGSGSVIHAAHHEQEMPQYGGLMRKIPITAITFAIAVLAIAGTPFLSGYYSKDLILGNAGAFAALAAQGERSKYYWLLFWIPTIIAYVTAFYMTRCWMLTFWGKPRNQHLYDHAHESPILFVPLIVLAVLSVIGGSYLGVRDLLANSVEESRHYCQSKMAPGMTFTGFDTAWPAKLPEHHEVPLDQGANPAAAEEDEQAAATSADASGLAHADPHDPLQLGTDLMHRYVFWAFVVGIGLGGAVYSGGYKFANMLVRIPPLGWIHTWLYRRMYFDELYSSVFIAITMGLSRFSAWFDRTVVDGIVNLAGWSVRQSAVLIGLHDKYVIDGAVNGAGRLTHDLGAAVRAPQTGRIRMYVTVLMVAVALGLAGAILVALS
ncbi:MAG: NADH-quinone oxidoreductase subunit L [Planctomycetota bacterium]|nr:NADH-quinone oxidoreductase subunit L [Planctomycetota bacterium]